MFEQLKNIFINMCIGLKNGDDISVFRKLKIQFEVYFAFNDFSSDLIKMKSFFSSILAINIQ